MMRGRLQHDEREATGIMRGRLQHDEREATA